MILSDQTIQSMLQQGTLGVSPITSDQIQPASIDLTLGDSFSRVHPHQADMLSLEFPHTEESFKSQRVIVPPQSFLLATTNEVIQLPDTVSAFVEGRSSIGRIGLFIQNAGWVDPGFHGEITLELFNANHLPIEIQAGRRICQLVFAKMDQSVKTPYAGKYQHQRGATGSRIYQDRDNPKRSGLTT
ncbi:dCTP deaminase [Alkalicoccus luteus]|uniref:dCTP deaminase n=1 Tax=Alkalicoccus luteus TaxID=1237094 RepID=UPI0040338DE4